MAIGTVLIAEAVVDGDRLSGCWPLSQQYMGPNHNSTSLPFAPRQRRCCDETAPDHATERGGGACAGRGVRAAGIGARPIVEGPPHRVADQQPARSVAPDAD